MRAYNILTLSGLKFARRPRCRQVAWFVIGVMLGIAAQYMIISSSSSPSVAQNVVEKRVTRSTLATNASLSPVKSVLLDLLADARRPRPISSRKKILRHAKDEVRMFNLLAPLVYHTNDGLTIASASTWFGDFEPKAKEVELFGPERLMKSMSGVGEMKPNTVHDSEERRSPTDDFVRMLESICNEVATMQTFDVKAKVQPKLFAFKWFALAHDSSYICLRKMNDFLSLHENPQAECFAQPRSGNDDTPVWSSRPGLVLNQRAVATVCPFLPQFNKHLSISADKELTFTALLNAAGVRCFPPNRTEEYFVDLAKRKLPTDALGKKPLSGIDSLKSGVFFSVGDEAEMYLLRRSDHLDAIAMYNAKIKDAHATLADMERLMHEHPLTLTEAQPKSKESNASMSLSISGVNDADTVWMSSDPSGQLSANFDGLAGQQRATLFAKDIEKQFEAACQHLSKKEMLQCISMVSGYMRFRPSVGMEYVYNLLAKSSTVAANNAKPLHHTVHMVRRLMPIKVSSIYELDVRSTTYVILPFDRQSPVFKQFMEMYERILVLGNNIVLVLAYFPDVQSQESDAGGLVPPRHLFSLYQTKYKSAVLKWVEVPGKTFNISRAVATALEEVSTDTAVLIASPMLKFNVQFLRRCHITSRPGRQSYYPLLKENASNPQCKKQEAVCAFKSDIVQSGWLTGNSQPKLGGLVATLKQRTRVIQAYDPDLTC